MSIWQPSCGSKTVTTGEPCQKKVKKEGDRCYIHTRRTNFGVGNRSQPFDHGKFIRQIERLSKENRFLESSSGNFSQRLLLIEEKFRELMNEIRASSEAKKTVTSYFGLRDKPAEERYPSETTQTFCGQVVNDIRSLDSILKGFLLALS